MNQPAEHHQKPKQTSSTTSAQTQTCLACAIGSKTPRTVTNEMIWYNLVSLLFLLTASLEASYGGDKCQYNSDCKNGTHACCHRRSQASVCRKTCDGESCVISWDCGTDLNMFCCENHICRSSSNMCPTDNYTPGWITAIVVIAILCAVFGIGGTILCIFLKHRRRSTLQHDRLLNDETVAGSTYGASWWLWPIQICWTRKLTDTK